MADDQPTEDVPTGYWVAFGYQNHVLPVPADDAPRAGTKVAALCGVLVPAGEESERDDRPVCAWCSGEVRAGNVRLVPSPS
ncbi:hypothetical protein ABT324_00395 [Saccharopolyspora sp. NPDC000359]|uniref:hypothetical protein n=1 Tax=Saccharopolyspora sp. NPDC000359 TaxID=3154251 RepID=UPI003316E790